MDGLLIRKLPITSLIVAAIALAATTVRDAPAAPIVVPPDPSAFDAQTLVSNVCSKCHGATGVSICWLVPNLAGQLPVYIETELKLFRHGAAAIPARAPFCGGTPGGLL